MVYEMPSRVGFSEINMKGVLSIESLINKLQDACSFHSDEVGYGLGWLSDRGLGWYITNWQLKINSLPKYGDKIIVSTWPYSFQGMFSKRNFTVSSDSGERLVEVDSLWILMDLKNVKPCRIPKDMVGAYGEVVPMLEGDWAPRKIPLFPMEDYRDGFEVTVSAIHLDTNQHMNNAYYIGIARNLVPKGEKVFGIRTEYKKSARLGDIIKTKSATKDGVVQVIMENAGACDGDKPDQFAVVEFLIYPERAKIPPEV